MNYPPVFHLPWEMYDWRSKVWMSKIACHSHREPDSLIPEDLCFNDKKQCATVNSC